MVNSQFMLAAYQILRSKTSQPTVTPRHTLTPTHKHISFSQDLRQNTSGKQRLKLMKKPITQNETEGNEPHYIGAKEDRFEIVVREGQEKRSSYRFTYTESHHPTEEGKSDQKNNIRLVIEGGHARRDLLKLNRGKLQAMIAKIREGKAGPSGEPNCMTEIVLQKFHPRSRGFFMPQPRKSLDWKMQPDRSTSPKQFDTRDYLICHSVRQERRNTPQTGGKAGKRIESGHGKQSLGISKGDMLRKNVGSSSKYVDKKYRRNPPKVFCKTESQLKNSSLSLFDHSSSFKRMQTSASFNSNTLQGWQQQNDLESFPPPPPEWISDIPS